MKFLERKWQLHKAKLKIENKVLDFVYFLKIIISWLFNTVMFTNLLKHNLELKRLGVFGVCCARPGASICEGAAEEVLAEAFGMALKSPRKESRLRTMITLIWRWRRRMVLWWGLRLKGICRLVNKWKLIVNDRVCQWGRSDSDLTGSQSMKQTHLHSWKWRRKM